MKRRTITPLLLTGLTLAGAIAVHAQSEAGAQAAARSRPCDSDPKYRQFDFWAGEWDVTAGGKKAGTNRIERIVNNCILFENWTGAGGGVGKSFNFYNNQTGKWNQVWVDGLGNNIQFEGEFHDGNLHYTAVTRAPGGERILHKLTFFPLDADRVRQLWEQSRDGGATWSIVFDGLYTRRE